MTIGARINQERKRLGYSQPAFAELGGASKGAQISWEKGTAYPNAAVLAEWIRVGADVTYILTGEPTKESALWCVLNSIQEFLLLNDRDEEIRAACILAQNEIDKFKRGDETADNSRAAIFAFLKKSPVLLLDQMLFEDILEKLEFVLDTKKITLTSSSKARVILNLYQAAQAGARRVDLGMVESSIKLSVP